MSEVDPAPNHPRPCRLSIFAFLWACQALEHQEFFSGWIRDNSVLGWTVTIMAAATLLWPGSLLLFTGMLASSVVFSFRRWPFVVNHILVETVVNMAILVAVATWLFRRRGAADLSARDEIFDRFAPVVRAMFVVMYCYAFLAKLNTGFLNPDVSCVVAMYEDVLKIVPFVPDAPWIQMPTIWLTLLIEASIPLLLTFRKTRPIAIVLGLAFHFVLGLIGHRTFSGLAYALYGLFCMAPLVRWMAGAQRFIERRLTPRKLDLYLKLVRTGCLLFFVLIAAELKLRTFLEFRMAPLAWVAWSLLVALVYLWALISSRRSAADLPAIRGPSTPGLLWLILVVVVLNGSMQYIGLKTQTNFTMYSNLRTEGGMNNHLFMPVFRLFDYQDDLVNVLETDHPRLQKYVDGDWWITHFEFRRIVSETTEDFQVTYSRGEEVQRFELRQGVSTDPALFKKHPFWLAKLLYFRPVDKAENPRCRH